MSSRVCNFAAACTVLLGMTTGAAVASEEQLQRVLRTERHALSGSQDTDAPEYVGTCSSENVRMEISI